VRCELECGCSSVSRNHGGPVAGGVPNAYGNGIFNDGTLILIHTDVVGNTGGFDVAAGGGIFNRGDARLVESRVSGNTSFSSSTGASGGGIYNGGSMTLTETPSRTTR
jgi:phage-related tail fiber protein